jgi:hypothetical protein
MEQLLPTETARLDAHARVVEDVGIVLYSVTGNCHKCMSGVLMRARWTFGPRPEWFGLKAGNPGVRYVSTGAANSNMKAPPVSSQRNLYHQLVHSLTR